MSLEISTTMRDRAARPGFRDLDRVALRTAATSDDGDVIPEGTQGTVVAVWREGVAYVVEFALPNGTLDGTLATCRPDMLRLVEHAEG